MRAWFLGSLAVLAACDCSGGGGGERCTTAADCEAGEVCRDGRCGPAPSRDGGPIPDTGPFDAGSCTDGVACGAICCTTGERCAFMTCVPDRGACSGADDCGFDSYCADGACVPWEVPASAEFDEACTRSIDIESLVPAEQCRWTGPPAGDGAPSHFQVMSTPVVVDFDADGDPLTLAPSIVFTTFPTVGSYSNPGVLRVIDGRTCEQQASFPAGADAVMSPAGVAAGDLDRDGHADVVAAAHAGGLIAFRFDPGAGSLVRWWHSGTCDAMGGRVEDTTGGGDRWNGPSLHDLDDDGVGEVIYGGTVYGADGCIIDGSLGFIDYHKGLVPVIADVDEDGVMELVNGHALHQWDVAMRRWVAESYFAAGPSAGQVAVADLGMFPLASMAGADRAEVVVVADGAARVQTIEGTVVFGPYAIPGGGRGGPPTIADFDGDGRREFATAGGTQYVVYDLDCVAGGDAARCGSGRTDGILWTQPSQDASSNVTGSSVFDFDADGRAEAVYADECYLRIYDGATGAVRYSAARSSGTTYENPVIADVDGDFHTEIVSSVNDYAGTLGCAGTDPLYPAATFATNHGIVVLRDIEDRWAASRPVWSQHAYAVTHVGNLGEIPRTSTVAVNWRDPALNNFRQNVQGDLEALGVPDLTSTVDPTTGPVRLSCDEMGVATLEARVCNRGALPIGAGVAVAFRRGDAMGEEICRATTPSAIPPGACVMIACRGMLPSAEMPIDVWVEADPDAGEDECHERNNWSRIADVACQDLM